MTALSDIAVCGYSQCPRQHRRTTGAGLLLGWENGVSTTHEMYELIVLLLLLSALVWQARGRASSQRAMKRLALREHERRIQQHEFVRDTSYAIRNTLTIARCHIESIHDSGVGGAVHEDTGVALEELDRIASITTDLLLNSELQRVDAISL